MKQRGGGRCAEKGGGGLLGGHLGRRKEGYVGLGRAGVGLTERQAQLLSLSGAQGGVVFRVLHCLIPKLRIQFRDFHKEVNSPISGRAGGDAGECQAAAQLSSRLLDRNLGTHQQSCPFSLQLEKRHPLQPHKAGASGMCTPKPCLGTLGRKGAPKISHPPTHIPEESPGPKLVEPAASPTSLAPVQPLRSQRSPSMK